MRHNLHIYRLEAVWMDKFIGFFISDQESEFYQSTAFTCVLQFVQENAFRVKLEEKKTRTGSRLLLKFGDATSIQAVHEILKPLMPKVTETS